MIEQLSFALTSTAFNSSS